MTEEQSLKICDNNINQQIKFVSHEIRNQLSISDMYSQIIKRNLEKEGIKNSSFENTLECIQKSVQIIGANIMDLKSVDSNCPKIYDFKTEVTKGVELAKAYTEDKNIDFEVFIKNTEKVFIDENRFLSCVVNIIKNGIESIEMKGKIAVLGEIKNNRAILKISNDGRPIPRDKQEDIFSQGYTTKRSGNGLGLSICRNYLESQNGNLRLNKSTKSETQFEIELPVWDDN